MNYVELVTKLRDAFPAPTLDQRQDAWLVQTINQAINDTTKLKNQSPILTVRTPRDYSEARKARMAVDANIDVPDITARLTEYLEGLTI